MSRIEHQQIVQGLVPAALHNVLTVPAGHKYEVLSGMCSGNPATETIRGFLATPQGLGIQWIKSETPPKDWATEWLPNNFCMLPGDVLWTYTQVQAHQVWLTYIDVSP